MVVILLLIVTTLLWGFTPILEKVALTKVDPLVGVTIRSALVTAGLFILTFLVGKGKALMEVDGRSFLLFGASGMMAGLLGMWTYYAALKMEATSKIVPIAASYPLVTALLSVLILRGRSDSSEGGWHCIHCYRHLVCQMIQHRCAIGIMEYWNCGMLG